MTAIEPGWICDVLRPVEPAEGQRGQWWGRYEAALSKNLTPRALSVVQADCRYVLDKGVSGSGPAGDPAWPVSRVRSGLVMGAVQSGKTASMLGVIAMALDQKIDIVVVLAGTQLSLWRQTYGRLRSQLDLEPEFDSEGPRRILLPGRAAIEAEVRPSPAEMYRLTRTAAGRVVEGHVPLLAVVMKHDKHLQAFGAELRESFGRIPVERPLHMMIVDDEADDGSILEPDSGPKGEHKQIPRSIAQLWSPGWQGGAGFWDRLHVTYVAYTATPQANLLQSDFNPLSPTDFLAALRTPADRGAVEERELTFREPRSRARYTGGQQFYEDYREHLVVKVPAEHDPLGDALRSFFVAGAIKVLVEPNREPPHESRTKLYLDRGTASALSPSPHTMLIHPSASVAAHFRGAAQVLAWTTGLDLSAAVAAHSAGRRHLDPTFLATRLEGEEADWRAWYDRFASSLAHISAQEGRDAPEVPAWSEVKSTLVDDIFPFTDIAVVNSDDEADERPAFDPVRCDGGWRAAPNLSTIFVAGNVMSRGLTLEGLTTTLFNRTSSNPLADTQMQMQRWFGYRGKDLHLTRLFIDEAQLELFSQYHETDVALRLQILDHMADDKPAPTLSVFEGPDFKATGKVSNLRHRALHPGKSVYLSGTNGADDPNNAVLASLFSRHESEDVVVGGTVRGRILSRAIGAEAAAELLESLSYVWRTDTLDEFERQRWRNVERMLSSGAESPILRLPSEQGAKNPESWTTPNPYSIAAYLRLWREVAEGRSRGGLVSLRGSGSGIGKREFAQAPRFNVGIRYGDGRQVTVGPWAVAPFAPRATQRSISLEGLVHGGWGSRNPGAAPGAYAADEYFDYHAFGHEPPAWDGSSTGWRPEGDDGLILFQLTEAEGGDAPAVSLGVVVPLGGPNQYPVYIEETTS